MSSADEPPSVSFQKSVVSANLSSTLLFEFLSGSYIGFFIFTLQVYSKSQSRQKVVIGTLTGLFVTIIIQLVLQWYFTDICFVGASENRLDIFLSSADTTLSPLTNVLNASTLGISQILADGLLVWRSWKFLSERRYLKVGLVCLYISESTIITTANILEGIVLFTQKYQTHRFARIINILQGTSFCTAAATSLSATFIIGAEIYCYTSLNTHARRRYRYIIETTIQSSALYTLAILGNTVFVLINNSNLDVTGSVLLNAGSYCQVLLITTTAFAPTLMVARLEHARDNVGKDHSTDLVSASPTSSTTPEPHDGSETNVEMARTIDIQRDNV